MSRRSKPKTHKDVSFAVTPHQGRTTYHPDIDGAAVHAIANSASMGTPTTLDVLVHSRAGAKWWGGDHAVEVYQEDPEASVHERFVVRAESKGRIS